MCSGGGPRLEVTVPLLSVLAEADSGYYGFRCAALAGATTPEFILDKLPVPASTTFTLTTMESDDKSLRDGRRVPMAGCAAWVLLLLAGLRRSRDRADSASVSQSAGMGAPVA